MFLDTTIIVELLGRPATDPLVRRIVSEMGDEVLTASVIQLGELADVARARNQTVSEAIRRAREILELAPLDTEIAVEASNLKAEARRRRASRDFSLIDGVVLAT